MRTTIPHLQQWRITQSGADIYYYAQSDSGYMPVTYAESFRQITNLSLGLWSLGLRHGQRAVILSHTRPEWMLADAAILATGGVVVGIYPTSTPEQIAYIVRHSQARLAFVEGRDLYDKIAALQPDSLDQIILMDGRDVPAGAWLTSAELAHRGLSLLAEQPNLPDNLRDAVQPDDLATLIYTSGTTGPPKGVVTRHRHLVEVVRTVSDYLGLQTNDVSLLYLPLAHSLQRVTMYIGQYVGITAYFLGDISRLANVCRETRPTVLSAVPRVYEKMQAAVTSGIEKSSPRRRQLALRALTVGGEIARRRRQGQPVPLTLHVEHALLDRLILRRLRAALFGGRMRYLSSGAAPINLELLQFFEAIGTPIYEGYGLTETTAPITVNRPGDSKLGTVGRPLPGSHVKIAADGEILLKGPGVFSEYFDNPEATRSAFSDDGWFQSGDIGELDADGYLRVTDRKKNLIITAGGKNVAPSLIENLILNSPYISQAMVHGDRRKYLVALLTLESEAIVAWAKQRGKQELSYETLSQDEDVIAFVDAIVQTANTALARFEQIKYFRILPEEMSIENGLLTPTLKIKRNVVEDEYRTWLDAMYDTAST